MMRKGITPIIAIIMLLLITVALAGASWSYMSAYFTGMTAKNIEISDGFCVIGDEYYAIFLLRNAGTQSFDPSEIIVLESQSGATPAEGDYAWEWINGTEMSTGAVVSPGEPFRYNLTCASGRLCGYRFLLGGRSVPGSVQC